MSSMRHHSLRALRLPYSKPPSTTAIPKELGTFTRQFSHTRPQWKKSEPQQIPQVDKHANEKPTLRMSSKARQTSLRSVGIAAAKKRQIIQDKGGLRIIDPEIETKVRTPHTY